MIVALRRLCSYFKKTLDFADGQSNGSAPRARKEFRPDRRGADLALTKTRLRDEPGLKRRAAAGAPKPEPAAAIALEFDSDRAVLVEAEITLAEQVDQIRPGVGRIKFEGGL
jgi:hypothetical protein